MVPLFRHTSSTNRLGSPVSEVHSALVGSAPRLATVCSCTSRSVLGVERLWKTSMWSRWLLRCRLVGGWSPCSPLLFFLMCSSSSGSPSAVAPGEDRVDALPHSLPLPPLAVFIYCGMQECSRAQLSKQAPCDKKRIRIFLDFLYYPPSRPAARSRVPGRFWMSSIEACARLSMALLSRSRRVSRCPSY